MSELLPLFLAGLAFFFIGVSGISTNLRQMSGRRLRRRLSKVTDKPLSAGICGILFGMLTQSASAVAFVLSGMIATGLITLRRALPVLACANIGTSLLVFLAALDLKIAIFWLLAVSGFSIAFKWAGRWTPAASALFYIGLLFYGLQMMKTAFAPLPDNETFQQIGAILHSYTYAPLLLGILLRVFIQSSSAIGVIAITLAEAGLVEEFQALLIICGAGIGVSIATYLMSGNIKGMPRQVIIFQALINAASGITIAAFLIIDRLFGGHIQDDLPGSLDNRIAWLFLILMLGCLFYAIITLKWMPGWLQRISPPTAEQDMSQPEYIHDGALRDPDTAADLANQELLRIAQLLPRYCEVARSGNHAALPRGMHHASLQLAQEIQGFIEDIVGQAITAEQSRSILAQKRLLQLITQLEDNVCNFAETLTSVYWKNGRPSLAENLIESLDTITLSTLDVLRHQDPDDLSMLLKMTEDRGELMESIRHSVHTRCETTEEQSALQYATSLFERNVWLFHQIALWAQSREKEND